MPLINVHLHLETAFDREVLEGIWRYALERGDWEIAVAGWREIKGGNEASADGHILRGSSPRALRRFAAAGRPAVSVTPIEQEGVDRIWCDDVAIGAMAAQHLIDRGFKHLGFRGSNGVPASDARREGFQAAVTAAGLEPVPIEGRSEISDDYQWIDDIQATAKLLQRLPRPMGVIGFTSQVGRRSVAAARHAGLVVPHDVAVVSCEEDPMVCEMSQVTVSGVKLQPDRIGMMAAERLAARLDGDDRPPGIVIVPPETVITRMSSSAYGYQDSQLGLALAYLEEHLHENLRITDLARAAGVSRRKLELLFRAELRCSPLDEVRRLRLERARGLLLTTQLSLADIATRVGYRSATHFGKDFLRFVGIQPARYRREGQAAQLDVNETVTVGDRDDPAR